MVYNNLKLPAYSYSQYKFENVYICWYYFEGELGSLSVSRLKQLRNNILGLLSVLEVGYNSDVSHHRIPKSQLTCQVRTTTISVFHVILLITDIPCSALFLQAVVKWKPLLGSGWFLLTQTSHSSSRASGGCNEWRRGAA